MATATLLLNRTTFPKPNEVVRKWYWIDAKDQVLGRLASKAASILMGKTKTSFARSVDCGDFVVVTNVDKIKLTGNKLEDKHAFYHTGHPGGAKITGYKKMSQEKPIKMLQVSVKRMLPKNKLASRQILRLKIYKGDTHPHAVQQPKKLEVVL